MWKAVYDHVAGGPAGPARSRRRSTTPRRRRCAAQVHQTLAKVTDDIGRRRTFNTAIAAVMELLNALDRAPRRATPADRAVIQEALEICGADAVADRAARLPRAVAACSATAARSSTTLAAAGSGGARGRTRVEIVVQVNGKLRGRVTVAADAGEETVRAAALADENVQRFVGGQAGAQGDRRAGQARQRGGLSNRRRPGRSVRWLGGSLLWPACGFQFRRAPDFRPTWRSFTYRPADRYSPFYRELVTVLRRSDVTADRDPAEARTVIRILGDETGRRQRP